MDKRKELKLKILGKYETVTNFAKAAGMSRQHISDIIKHFSGEELIPRTTVDTSTLFDNAIEK